MNSTRSTTLYGDARENDATHVHIEHQCRTIHQGCSSASAHRRMSTSRKYRISASPIHISFLKGQLHRSSCFERLASRRGRPTATGRATPPPSRRPRRTTVTHRDRTSLGNPHKCHVSNCSFSTPPSSSSSATIGVERWRHITGGLVMGCDIADTRRGPTVIDPPPARRGTAQLRPARRRR